MKKGMWLVLAMVVALCAGCGSDGVQTVAPLPVNKPVGTAHVAKSPIGAVPVAVPFGQTNIPLMTFTVAVSVEEDGVLEFVIPEVYSKSLGELLPTATLQNVRVISGSTQIGPAMASLMSRPAAPENSWKDTTYVYLPVNDVIPKATVKTYTIVADAGWAWIDHVVLALPDSGTGMFADGIASHIIVRGVTSGKIMRVTGEAIGTPVTFYDPFPYYGGKG